MEIDYLIPDFYMDFDMEAPRNAGGGMVPNIHTRADALREYYDVRLIHATEQIESDFCLIESLWFSLSRDWEDGITEAEIKAKHAARIDKLFETPAKKIVACCELEIARIPWWSRAKIKHYPLGIVVNTRYLWNICKALGIVPIGYLGDAIDPYLFKPGKKELSVIAVGGLKHIKNPYLLLEVFEKLQDTGMKRIYIGSPQIWSNESRPEDAVLAKQLQGVVDVWIENASYLDVAYHLSTGGIGINDTWHDVSSRTHQEMLMSGMVTIGGNHPVFQERPGIHSLKTADEFVDVIRETTYEFFETPMDVSESNRQWALENLSTDVFIKQFMTLLKNVYF